MRVAIAYRWRHGRWPNLRSPELFTEWVQWRKLNDEGPALALLTDKLHSKAVVAQCCGASMCVPTLWSGTVPPLDPPGPLPLIVKANHGCGQWRLARTPAEWRRARAAAMRWLRRGYGAPLDEHHYRSARRLVLVEPFLGEAGGRLPDDYKVYVFGGQAAIVQHHVGRGSRAHRWTQFDRDWRRVGGDPGVNGPPQSLTAMIEAAERLGAGHDFLRVDFYEVDGRLWFGEFCLFPGSGLDPFEPLALDRFLGGLWSAAARRN